MAPLQVWHLQDSRSFRVVWLLEELGVPYDLVYAKRENKRAPANFKSKHGMGKAPMLVLEDGEMVLVESSAICDYIVSVAASADQKKQFFGGGSEVQAAQVRSWMAWSEAALLLHALPITYARWNLPDEAKSVLPQYEKALGVNVVNDLEYLENTVKTNGSGYIYGNDLSLADIMTAFSAQFVLARGLGAKWEDDSYPTVKDWIRRLMKRDAWKRAVNQGEDSYTLDKETP